MPGGLVGWDIIALFAVLATACTLRELWRGGYMYGAIGLAAEGTAWYALALHYRWSDEVTVALLAAVAVTWIAAALLLRRGVGTSDAAEPSHGAGIDGWRGIASAAQVADVGGLVLLALTSIAVLAVTETIPLAGMPVERTAMLLAVALLACWKVAALMRAAGVTAGDIVATATTRAVTEPASPRGTPPPTAPFVSGAALVAWSFWTIAAIAAWAWPELHSATYALALLGLCALWHYPREPFCRLFGLNATAHAWAMRGLSLIIVAVGVMASAAFFDVAAWETVVLLAAAALWWFADAALTGPSAGTGVAAALAVAAAAVAGDVASAGSPAPHTPGYVGFPALAGAGKGAGIAALAAIVRRWWPRHAAAAAVGAAIAATLAAATAASESFSLAGAFALAAAAWALTAYATAAPVLALAAALLGEGTLIAVVDASHAAGWVTALATSVYAFALLTPSFLVHTRAGLGPPPPAARLVRTLAAGGLLALVFLTALRFLSPVPTPTWLHMSGHTAAALWLALAVYLVASSAVYRIDIGLYVGAGVGVIALWTETRALGIEQIEAFTLPLALYLVAMGYLWVARGRAGGSARTIPPVLDIAATFVGVGIPALLSTSGPDASVVSAHAFWAVGLALLAIGGGVTLKVRAYFFGGVAALVWTAFWRSVTYLVAFWWLILGIIGVAMLVVALTWERERMVAAQTRARVRDTFVGWR
ncbi:MAG: hypothetical protein Q8K89_04670 [Actinomycetota bacterium]|nr:hypothetical protein [Actinomycetota bacterium]